MKRTITCVHCDTPGESNRMKTYTATYQQGRAQRFRHFLVHRNCYGPFALKMHRELALEQLVRTWGGQSAWKRLVAAPELFRLERQLCGIRAAVGAVWVWIFRKP